jgi:stage II sporulation protein GA (sporulation sigma-E factor processing peptidase)
MFIGGGVYYGYLLLERYLSQYFTDDIGGAERRDIIILSTLILFVIGVLKLLIMLFGMERHIKSVRVKIEIADRSIEVDALVDSGNLVRDPMSMNPVLFVKRNLAGKLLPINIIELTNIDDLECSLRKRIRLIPVTKNGNTHVMTGVRTDRVAILGADGEDEVRVTLAIDKEEGSYGGYEALLPVAVVEDGI